MNGNNTHDEEEYNQRIDSEIKPADGVEPTESWHNRINEAEEMQIIGTYSNKLSRETLAEIIGQYVHKQTAAGWRRDGANMYILNHGADSVRPEDIIKKMNIEEWRGVQGVEISSEEIKVRMW